MSQGLTFQGNQAWVRQQRKREQEHKVHHREAIVAEWRSWCAERAKKKKNKKFSQKPTNEFILFYLSFIYLGIFEPVSCVKYNFFFFFFLVSNHFWLELK